MVTLPVCAVLATILWWWPQQAFTTDSLIGWGLCATTTSICMETNAIQHIIRIRTRMMACVWLVLTSCLSFMHPLGAPAISAVCLAMSYYLLFRSYQLYAPTLWVFHSFLFLGLGSLFSAVLLPMGILYYIYLIGFMRAFTWRGFWAGILGTAIPYWCWAVWCFLTNKTDYLLEFLSSHFLWQPVSWQAITSLSLATMVSAGIVILLSLVGMIHYLQTKYNDKIRVRMILYIYTTQTILFILYLFLQPNEYQNTMSLLLVSSCPLIAHYFSLTKSWLSNAFFILSLLLCGAMAYFNLWMP
ncbi:MAG: hypothetical protein J6W52_07095 [Bacteroidaceae bacterium]|nr:hypothetical protein [Bacteroidaceae bacterium]